MKISEFLMLLCVFLLVYHHILYPWILKLIVKNFDSKMPYVDYKQDLDWPKLSIVIPCYNEEKVIAQKLHNLNFLDYPRNLLDIILINDGCTDNTAHIIKDIISKSEFEHLKVTVIENKVNLGKVASLNKALSIINEGVIVLSDASALISIDALKRAALALNQPSIGVVCASYKIFEEGNKGELNYWDYQSRIKHMESYLGASIGAHGALYAFKASVCSTLDSDIINDDFVLPMNIARKGYHCLYDQNMISVELERSTVNQDFSRRQRIAAGNIQQALRLKGLLNPKYGWLALNFFSGKWLRCFVPFILVFFLILSMINPMQSAFVSALFILQITGYSLALIRHLTPTFPWPALVNKGYYVVSAYTSSLIGSIHYLLNPEHFYAWKRANEEDPAKETSFLSPGSIMIKRSSDLLVASVALMITLPLWPFIALAIKLESKGPIIFKQLRIGKATPKKTNLFYMMKFRTMSVDAELKSGAVWATKQDPRITKVGSFLRKTRLDELPQLMNVLLGDMSVVGPRPERPGIARDLDQALPYYAERTYFVNPGITGLAQVNQGYDQCLDDVKNKLLYDHSYALALSKPLSCLKMDLYIAFKTVWVMVNGRGQ